MGFKKICSTCNKIIDRGTECECRKKQKAESDKEYNRFTRDKESMKIYESKQWKKIRMIVKMRDDGLCQLCLHDKRVTPIEPVHHIVEVKDSHCLAYDVENLIGLCDRCHRDVHRAYNKSNESKRKMIEHLRELIKQ